MFDTMTMTKILGAFCGTFLVLLLGAWVAEELYHVGGGGHGDDHAQGYLIEVPETAVAGAEPEEEVDFSVFMASASIEDGAGTFRACAACHALEAGANGVGPYLYGVVGREVGVAEGYTAYSGALSEVAQVWDADSLNAFLENPKGYAPGTSMGYNGMRKVEDRANLIAYLDSLDN